MRQRLGQHFLINNEVLQKIVDSLCLKAGDLVVEIGPGHGELTKRLMSNSPQPKIIAIEKDPRLAKEMGLFKTDSGLFEVIEGDALKILPEISKEYGGGNVGYKIVGNIPYYITGFLLRLISELENKPELVVLTIQKEVADRICAEPPKMNLLAASVQFWAKTEIIKYVPKRDFNPPPEVDSAVIKLTTLKADERIPSEKYYQFIKIFFKQPRKNTLNNLRDFFPKEKITEVLKSLDTDPLVRPQDVPLEKIKMIVEKLL